MSPILQTRKQGQKLLTSGNTKNHEKDTRLYHSKLELGEEAYEEVHKETHLWRASKASHSFSPLWPRHFAQKLWAPPAFLGWHMHPRHQEATSERVSC